MSKEADELSAEAARIRDTPWRLIGQTLCDATMRRGYWSVVKLGEPRSFLEMVGAFSPTHDITHRESRLPLSSLLFVN